MTCSHNESTGLKRTRGWRCCALWKIKVKAAAKGEVSVPRAFSMGMVAFIIGCDQSYADSGKPCQQQKDEIIYERDQAIRSGNIYKQRGLESALYRVERYCRDDVPSQREDRLSRALQDVQRREDQLDAAIESGSPRMVERYKQKLEQARERLHSASAQES